MAPKENPNRARRKPKENQGESSRAVFGAAVIKSRAHTHTHTMTFPMAAELLTVEDDRSSDLAMTTA